MRNIMKIEKIDLTTLAGANYAITIITTKRGERERSYFIPTPHSVARISRLMRRAGDYGYQVEIRALIY
jgi:hypothetical protein